MRTAEETRLLPALFITKYRTDSYLYVFLKCLMNLDWHDSCRNKILKPRDKYWEVLFFLGSVSMPDKVSLVATQTYNQSTFYRQRAKRGKFVISRSFFYKEIKLDIAWWLTFLPLYNGVSFIKPDSWSFEDLHFSTDSCLHGAAAGLHASINVSL